MFKQALQMYSYQKKKKKCSSAIPVIFNEKIHYMMLPWPRRFSEQIANLISLAMGFMEAVVLAWLISSDFLFCSFVANN